MESVGQTRSHMNRARQFNYEDLVAQILADQEWLPLSRTSLCLNKKFDGVFQNLINISERKLFSYWGDPDYIAKGLSSP